MIKRNYYPVIKDNDLICKVENYTAAKNDTKVTWHLHHRLAITFNLDLKQMKEWNIYKHCDPEDLIFLKPGDHARLHSKFKKCLKSSSKHESTPYDPDKLGD